MKSTGDSSHIKALFLTMLVLVLLLSLTGMSSAQKRKLTVGTWFTVSDFTSRWGNWLDQFKQEHPDIDVEIIRIAGHGEYSAKLLVLASTGDLPDILQVPPEDAGSLVAAGILADLKPWIDRDPSLDQSTWLKPTIGATEYRGVNFGFPAYVVNYAYAYNPDIFAERGVAPPDPNSWMTWDQIVENGKRTTVDKDGDGSPEIWGYLQRTGFDFVLPLIYQSGGRVFDENEHVLFDSTETLESVEWLLGLMYEEGIHPPPGVPGSFEKRSVASIRMGSWQMPGILRQENPIPVNVVAGTQRKQKSEIAYVTTWSITRDVRDSDAAWTYLKWMTSPTAQAYFARAGLVPMRTDVDLPDATAPMLQGFIRALAGSRSMPHHTYYTYIRGEWGKAMEPVWKGEQTAESTLKGLSNSINAYLTQQMKK